MWVTALLCCLSTSALAQETVQLFDAPASLKAPMLKIGHQWMTGLPGDLNRDAMFDVADVSLLIRAVLNGDDPSGNADVTLDGEIDVADVSILIRRILTSEAPSMEVLQGTLDDVYRSMRTAGWATTGNTHQTFGILAQTLIAEVMGDDMMMGSQGSGWFWYDASYNVKQRYTSTSWTSFYLWYSYYTWIANANYLINAVGTKTGNQYNYVLGQAYAIRAYSYFMLAQWFARTYKGHEDEPCVPIYDGITFSGSTGQPRSTVSEVYNRITLDIAQALTLLSGTTQQEPHHIGYAVAQGLRARIALVKEDWQTAYNAANAAINNSGKTVQNVADFKGLNDATAGNVMWGAVIPTEENGQYASFWAHMSADMAYGQRAPKQISKWLYNKMSDTDSRRTWWTENITGNGSDALVQNKFMVKDGTEWDGDYIYMRVEEMYLTAAEALCRRGMYSYARNFLNQVMSKRDPNYTCASLTGNTLSTLTTEEEGTLLEEIILQRRLELWGEDGRIHTICRLHQGFERTTENGWPASLTAGHAWSDPECYAWVMTIPQSEFDGNPNMDPEVDQNPLGDYSAVGMHISLAQSEYSTTTARESMTISIPLTRAVTTGGYTASLRVTGSGSASISTADFADGSATATANLNLSGLELGKVYTYVVSLSATDQASYDPSQGEQITSMTVTVQCVNGDASLQHVSFESGSVSYETQYSSMSIPVTLTRATAQGEYRTTIAIEDNDPNVSLGSPEAVTFADGRNTATAYVYFNQLVLGETYSCVLKITDTQGAAGGQYQSVTITVSRPDVEPAGNVTFTDYTFNAEGSFNCITQVQHIKGTNDYYIVDPFYYMYDEYDCPQGNWHFTLNSDGSITPAEGYWNVYVAGYKYLYDSVNYATYCYVEHDGDTYTVHYIVETVDTQQKYRGSLAFVWNRE